ncbi:MAG TPA: hypothetical protein VHB20_05455 [Verrucomicrobiae bacterium]|nr:hypothetical protein [Verrucomicrobiae bacterium]
MSLNESKAADAASFDWPLAFAAEEFLRLAVDSFLGRNRFAQQLSLRMREETGTDFFEWIDYLTLPDQDVAKLRELGFEPDKVETPQGECVLVHPRATLPRVMIAKPGADLRIVLRPESVADFVAAHSLLGQIEGAPCSRLRRVLVNCENGTRLEAIERNGYRGFIAAPLHFADLRSIMEARELWRIRRRRCGTDSEGFAAASETLSQVLKLVGQDLACQFFFEEERRYWESRNQAAQIQKRRQDQLGLGWGNHDHHTFRCSREHFVDVVEFFMRLGFHKRERYYTGAEAGWGAQIMEQPNVGIVVFSDVDLQPDETKVDFSTVRLAPAAKLGTVGLWVGLHGESFLEAGMHHLEARFDFDALRDQLAKQGVRMMKPFSDFQFLRQAFSEGERWPVQAGRLDHLTRAGLLTPEQAEKFSSEGALGSHLENLQRKGGFKGFNQKSVSVIISATDPRKNLQAA